MIHFDNMDHAKVIAAKAGVFANVEVDNCVSRTNDEGKLLGGALYQDFTGASIVVHLAGLAPNWASRDLLWVGFDYPFTQLGCSKMFGHVPSSNKAALALDYKLGFKYVTTVSGVYLDADLVVLEMNRTDCRWLRLKPRTLSRRA